MASHIVTAMESILGGLAFAGVIAAQFLAVVAVHKTMWNGSPSGKADLHRRARAVTSNKRSADCEVNLTIRPVTPLG